MVSGDGDADDPPGPRRASRRRVLGGTELSAVTVTRDVVDGRLRMTDATTIGDGTDRLTVRVDDGAVRLRPLA